MSRNTATDDWARHKDDIHCLYILENKPLLGEGGVIESMKEQFGFDKSKSQYETQFRKWGFRKYSKGIPADVFKIAGYRVEKARRQGTEIRAFQGGKKVTPKVLRTRGYLTAQERMALEQATTPPTPPDFTFRMPSASPRTQHPTTTPRMAGYPAARHQPSPLSFASPGFGPQTPQPFSPGLVSSTPSQQVFSPALSDLSVLHRDSTFTGQSPATINQPLSESIQRTAQPIFRQLFPSQYLPPIQEADTEEPEPASHRYRQKDEDRIREELLTMDMLHGRGHPGTLDRRLDLCNVLLGQGRYKAAEQEIRKSVDAITSASNSQEHMTDALNLLGWILYHQGRDSEAIELNLRLLETQKRTLGPDNTKTLASMASLAASFCSQGRWAEAESLEVQVVEADKRTLGPEHLDTLISMLNLAGTYQTQGRHAEAEVLGLKVLEARKRKLGLEHPSTLDSMSILASSYQGMGRWAEAKELYLQVLEARKRILGPEHPDTLNSLHNLASSYEGQRRWAEAETLHVQAMEARKRILGPEHPDTLISIKDVAHSHRHHGRQAEAKELYLQVLEARKRILGPEHPDTLNSLHNLASSYEGQRRWAEAETLHVQAMEARKRVLGPEHPHTLDSLHKLAILYSGQDRWVESEKLEKQLMEASKRVLGPEHPTTLDRLHNLAITWKVLGRVQDAQNLMLECVRLSRQVLGEEDPKTLDSVSRLSRWTDLVLT